MPLLPAAAIPQEALAKMADYLVSLARFGQVERDGTFTHELPGADLLGILGLLCTQEVDMRAPEGGQSPLLSLLARDGSNRKLGAIEGRRLPRQLDDTNAHPGWRPHSRSLFLVADEGQGRKELAIDEEWAGAWMMALGADPWVREQPGALWESAGMAMVRKRFAGLFSLAIEHPSFPGTAALWEHGWHHLLRSLVADDGDEAVAIMEALLVRGLNVGEQDYLLPRHACPRMAELLFKHGAWPADEGVQKKLGTEWSGRYKSGQMDDAQLKALLALNAKASGKPQRVDEMLMQQRVEKVLGPKNEPKQADVRSFRSIKQWKGDELRTVVEKTSGPLRGSWPVWAALAAGTVRGNLPWFPVPGQKASEKDAGLLLRRAVTSAEDKARRFCVEGRADLSGQEAHEWREGILAIGWMGLAIGGAVSRTGVEAAWEALAEAFGKPAPIVRKMAIEAALPAALSAIGSGLRDSPGKEVIAAANRLLEFEPDAGSEANCLALAREVARMDLGRWHKDCSIAWMTERAKEGAWSLDGQTALRAFIACGIPGGEVMAEHIERDLLASLEAGGVMDEATVAIFQRSKTSMIPQEAVDRVLARNRRAQMERTLGEPGMDAKPRMRM